MTRRPSRRPVRPSASSALARRSTGATPALTPAEATGVRNLIGDAWSPATRRAYTWAWARFEAWCRAHGRGALPASLETWLAFLADTTATTAGASEGPSFSALATMKAAVRLRHEAAGERSPTDDPAARSAWKGVRARLGVAPQRQKLPTTYDVLAKMMAKVDRRSLEGKRDAALLLLGFHAALRRSELVALRVADVKPWTDAKRGAEGLTLHIRRSKTDREGKGHLVDVIRFGGSLCAVTALEEWLRSAKITAGSIFPGRSRSGTIGAQEVAFVVQRYASAARFDPRGFGAHSLRAGFVTEAYRRGAPEAAIMGTTRHRSVATLARYRREGDAGKRGAESYMAPPA